jgi:hypothetical protein
MTITEQERERPSRPKKTAVTFRVLLSDDQIGVLDDMMRAGRWPNRTTLVKSMIQSIIEDEVGA